MARDWLPFADNKAMPEDKRTVTKRERNFQKKIRNVKTLTLDQMVEKQEENAAAALAREENLLAALKDNKLKSNALIKEATAIQKKRNKKKNTNKEN